MCSIYVFATFMVPLTRGHNFKTIGRVYSIRLLGTGTRVLALISESIMPFLV